MKTSFCLTGFVLMKILATARRNRITFGTQMNQHSSRSHALLCITVQGTDLATGSKTTGKLNLVDLAGSERVWKSGAEGERLKEAQNINRSLLALGDVIQALRARQTHIPFRNSRLTYLLQDSLGKGSKTVMVVQVSALESNVGETLCSLKFAQRVCKVELGPAARKIESEGTLLISSFLSFCQTEKLPCKGMGKKKKKQSDVCFLVKIFELVFALEAKGANSQGGK
uniref:Kinesin motor domain-containing protein n=1 Tax=Oryzias melastigma TaxID=30732 RepID=A0A3B3DJF4_ORYME